MEVGAPWEWEYGMSGAGLAVQEIVRWCWVEQGLAVERGLAGWWAAEATPLEIGNPAPDIPYSHSQGAPTSKGASALLTNPRPYCQPHPVPRLHIRQTHCLTHPLQRVFITHALSPGSCPTHLSLCPSTKMGPSCLPGGFVEDRKVPFLYKGRRIGASGGGVGSECG